MVGAGSPARGPPHLSSPLVLKNWPSKLIRRMPTFGLELTLMKATKYAIHSAIAGLLSVPLPIGDSTWIWRQGNSGVTVVQAGMV